MGERSHAKMSPPYRLEMAKKLQAQGVEAKKAGVLSLFYPNQDFETCMALILRKSYSGVHSAQVAFPGGRYELQDEDLMQTALRETKEEIGVSPRLLSVLKPMSPLYIPPSNYLVHPYVGLAYSTPQFTKQESEVDDIIQVKLLDLLDEANAITTKVSTSYNVDVTVPAYQLNGHIVWGATAMIMSELKDLLNEIL